MAVILKDLDIEALFQKIAENAFFKKTVKFVKTNRIFIKFASMCLVSAFAFIISIASVGITLGFNVKYSGKVIATVNNTSVFENAKNIALNAVQSNSADKLIASPKFTLTLTVTDKLANAAKLATAIIENTEEFVESTALVVNGETLVCAESKTVSDLLEKRRTSFFVEGAENTAYFEDDIELVESYYLKEDISDEDTAANVIGNLSVRTISVATNEKAIPFSTKTIYTTAKQSGYSKVTTAGKNGITRETVRTESVNGQLSSQNVLEKTVVAEPVQEVVTKGTATARMTATQKAAASSKGFICPIARGKFRISSYYGDGRNHKGIDMCADKGVAIFSVAAGTVTYAGYRNDYGYNVVVDHGNGIQTRYAHASALCVSKGDKVSQGDMLAAVGSTGYSTGNHLHFEVIVNGRRVNPAAYIGV